jgi:hypothetical protein
VRDDNGLGFYLRGGTLLWSDPGPNAVHNADRNGDRNGDRNADRNAAVRRKLLRNYRSHIRLTSLHLERIL